MQSSRDRNAFSQRRARMQNGFTCWTRCEMPVNWTWFSLVDKIHIKLFHFQWKIRADKETLSNLQQAKSTHQHTGHSLVAHQKHLRTPSMMLSYHKSNCLCRITALSKYFQGGLCLASQHFITVTPSVITANNKHCRLWTFRGSSALGLSTSSQNYLLSTFNSPGTFRGSCTLAASTPHHRIGPSVITIHNKHCRLTATWYLWNGSLKPKKSWPRRKERKEKNWLNAVGT